MSPADHGPALEACAEYLDIIAYLRERWGHVPIQHPDERRAQATLLQRLEELI